MLSTNTSMMPLKFVVNSGWVIDTTSAEKRIFNRNVYINTMCRKLYKYHKKRGMSGRLIEYAKQNNLILMDRGEE